MTPLLLSDVTRLLVDITEFSTGKDQTVRVESLILAIKSGDPYKFGIILNTQACEYIEISSKSNIPSDPRFSTKAASPIVFQMIDFFANRI